MQLRTWRRSQWTPGTGSALQYARRYLLCGILSLVTVGEDDDATAGDMLGERQRDAIEDLIGEIGDAAADPF